MLSKLYYEPNVKRKGKKVVCRGQILPGDPVPPIEREEANEEFTFLSPSW